MALSCLTPLGQITIPRSIMKLLGIEAESYVVIEIDENNQIVLKKMENNYEDKSAPVFKVI